MKEIWMDGGPAVAWFEMDKSLIDRRAECKADVPALTERMSLPSSRLMAIVVPSASARESAFGDGFSADIALRISCDSVSAMKIPCCSTSIAVCILTLVRISAFKKTKTPVNVVEMITIYRSISTSVNPFFISFLEVGIEQTPETALEAEAANP